MLMPTEPSLRPAPADIVIAELMPADRAAIAFEFRRLGEQSRYQRFLAIKRELTAVELDRLTNIDHWHHEAVIARSPVPRAPIAIARYVRTDEFDTADIAIEVVDEWQRRGIGMALLLALRDRALGAGIRRFTATTLAGNLGALALIRRLGPYRVTGIDGDVLEIEIDLTPAAVAAAGTPAAAA
jgi:RimJ/RimL family protein N-acetyltransferase